MNRRAAADFPPTGAAHSLDQLSCGRQELGSWHLFAGLACQGLVGAPRRFRRRGKLHPDAKFAAAIDGTTREGPVARHEAAHRGGCRDVNRDGRLRSADHTAAVVAHASASRPRRC